MGEPLKVICPGNYSGIGNVHAINKNRLVYSLFFLLLTQTGYEFWCGTFTTLMIYELIMVSIDSLKYLLD